MSLTATVTRRWGSAHTNFTVIGLNVPDPDGPGPRSTHSIYAMLYIYTKCFPEQAVESSGTDCRQAALSSAAMPCHAMPCHATTPPAWTKVPRLQDSLDIQGAADQRVGLRHTIYTAPAKVRNVDRPQTMPNLQHPYTQTRHPPPHPPSKRPPGPAA